jgi:hypothetical protein
MQKNRIGLTFVNIVDAAVEQPSSNQGC